MPMTSCVEFAVSKWGHMAAEMSIAGILFRLLNVRNEVGDIKDCVFSPTTDIAHPLKHDAATMIQQDSPQSSRTSGVLPAMCMACATAAPLMSGRLRILLYHARSSTCARREAFVFVAGCSSFPLSILIFVSTVYSVVQTRCAEAHAIPSMFARMSSPQ